MAFELTEQVLLDALEKAGGQPTKAAAQLGITYVHYWRLTKDIEGFKELAQAYRAQSFQELNALTLTAIKSGVLPRAEKEIGVDGKEKTVTKLDKVDVRTRLEMATRIMNITKSDAGIVEQSQVKHEAGDTFLDFLKSTSSE